MRQIGLMRQLIFDDALVPHDGLHTHTGHTYHFNCHFSRGAYLAIILHMERNYFHYSEKWQACECICVMRRAYKNTIAIRLIPSSRLTFSNAARSRGVERLRGSTNTQRFVDFSAFGYNFIALRMRMVALALCIRLIVSAAHKVGIEWCVWNDCVVQSNNNNHNVFVSET